MPAHPLVEDLRHRIEGKFAWFCDQDVHYPQKIVGPIDGVEDIVVQEYMQTPDGAGPGVIGEAPGLLPGEMSLQDVRFAGELLSQPFPVDAMISEIHEQA